MIGPPSGTPTWIVAGFTDLRRGFDALCTQIQDKLNENPFSGDIYIFRGRRGDKIRCSGTARTACACFTSA